MHWPVLVVILFTAVICSVQARAPLGCGLNGVSDFSQNNPFINVAKQSRKFGSPTAPWEEKTLLKGSQLDENGFPKVDFGAIFLTGQLPNQMNGSWILKYTGVKCNVSPIASYGVTLSNHVCSGGVCSISILCSSDATQMYIAFTGTTGGVRDIQLHRPWLDPEDIFDPSWVGIIRPFAGALRFMDWQQTNGNTLAKWSDRTLPTDAIWTVNGVPYEVQIALGNKLNRNIWINIPVSADDDFVKQLATLVQNNLNPNLAVFVEYSNELWNTAFPQWTTTYNLALDMCNDDPNCPLNYDKQYNTYHWAWRRTAYRLMEISNLFASVWGQAAINKRVRCVYATQIAYTFVAETGLQMINELYGPPSQYFFALAGAPYFNLGKQNSNNSLSTQDVLNLLRAAERTSDVDNYYEYNYWMSKYYNLRFLGYEGGPDTFGNCSIKSKRLSQLDPQMGDIVVEYLDKWFAYDFGAFNWFVCDPTGAWDGPYGTWGLLQSGADLSVPKYRAAVDYVQSTPARTGGFSVDNKLLDMRNWVGRKPVHQYKYFTVQWTGSYSYVINAPATGVYAVSISASDMTDKDYTLPISTIETKSSNTIYFKKNTKNTFVYSSPVNITLKQGLNVFVMNYLDGYTYSMQYAKFELLDSAPDAMIPDPNHPDPDPTFAPTKAPTNSPTRIPTSAPPTSSPPTAPPTRTPTSAPPTNAPPTRHPTSAPPTSTPTRTPTRSPTSAPPTNAPPTRSPTSAPPTNAPPTSTPTRRPTSAPVNGGLDDESESM